MLVGLGGTIRTLARIQRAAERRGVKGLKPERADVIVAGAVIVVEETFGRVTSS